MSARVNLAPEVYQASQRNKRRRKVATSLAITINAVVVGLVVAGLIVIGGQKVASSELKKQIKDRQDKVATYSDLTAAATAQQHLETLGSLSGQKVYMSRFFSVLQSLAPQGMAVSNVNLSADRVLEITASARSYDLVTKFAKALEESNVNVGANAAASNAPYFTNVQLSSVTGSGGKVDFKMTTQVAPEVTNGQ